MKAFIIITIFIIGSYIGNAQNVLIGTGTPNATAILEIRKSANKGVLIPRMTSAQRTTIPSPVAGLLVYDSTRDELYGHNGTSWRYFLDNSFWGMNGTNVYNVSDSIGIGISSPDEKLHVNGTMKTSNGDLLFTETSGTSSKLISDYNGLNVNGYDHNINFYDGTLKRGLLQYQKFDVTQENRIDFHIALNRFSIQANGISTYTAADGTLQLQNNGVEKGFVQLSGNDFRLGTYSSNTNGRFIIRSGASDHFTVDGNGVVRIGSNAVQLANTLNIAGLLKASGNLTTNSGTIATPNIEINGEVNLTASGSANMVPIYYGKVTAAGVCSCSSSEAVVTHPFYGNYVLDYPNRSSNDLIMISIHGIDYRGYGTHGGLGPNYPGFLIIPVFNNYSGSTTADVDFSFMVFKQ
jgi:hypothetical protein